MDVLSSLSLIALAALIHASFQLSVSMFTLLSGHAIGRATSRGRLLRMSGMFTFGVLVMTMLLVSFIVLLYLQFWRGNAPIAMYSVASGLAIGIGVAVWIFYYRRKRPGTALWLPNGLSKFIESRIKATRRSPEAFSLGLSSVIAEVGFLIAPIACASLEIARLNPPYQIIAIVGYAIIATLPLVVVVMRVNAGTPLSNIQKWRERNKRFLQFIAGSALIVLGFYLYANELSAIANATFRGTL